MKKFIPLFFLVIIIFSVFCIPVSAAEMISCPLCGEEHEDDFKSKLGKIAYEMNCTVYSGNIFSDTENELFRFDAVKTEDKTDKQENGTESYNKKLKTGFEKLWNEVGKQYDIVIPFGEVLLMVYVLVQILEELNHRTLTPEHLLKGAIKFIVGVLIIRYGFTMLSYAVQFNVVLFEKIKTGTGIVMTGDNCIYDKIVDEGFRECIVEMLSVFVPWVILKVVKIGMYVVAWTRIIEICLRAMFLPIGLADFTIKGRQSNGFRYFKKLVAVILQGSIIIGLSKCYGLIYGTVDGASWVLSITLGLVLLVACFKGQQLADDIMGV